MRLLHILNNKTSYHLIKNLILIMTLLPYQFAHAGGQFSGINKITFNDNAYSKSFVGNGFLINYQDKVYAVTVKHTLLEARTPKMKHVDIEQHVKEWIIHPNKSPQLYIKLGKLLNANASETIDIKVLSNDWLVFEVLENKSKLKILSLRKAPLKAGETLTAFGCSYANKATCEQDIYQGSFIANEPNNLRVSMPDLDLSKLKGLSGSPVLDKNNQVVGIVSNIMKSTSGEGFDFAPANLNYLLAILQNITS